MKTKEQIDFEKVTPERKAYDSFYEEAMRRNLSNTQAWDNAILTLSSVFLGFSLSFFNTSIPPDKACAHILLPISWWVFAISILITFLSFMVSNIGLKKQLQKAEEYYLKGNEEALSHKNRAATFVILCNWAAGIMFVCAMLLTVIFFTLN